MGGSIGNDVAKLVVRAKSKIRNFMLSKTLTDRYEEVGRLLFTGDVMQSVSWIESVREAFGIEPGPVYSCR